MIMKGHGTMPTKAAAMYEYYQTGRTLAEVGTHFGISKQRVSQVFIQHGYKTIMRYGQRRSATKATMQNILMFIPSFRKQFGESPTLAQIAVAVGRSEADSGNIHGLVEQLIAEGFLIRGKGAGTLVPVEPDKLPWWPYYKEPSE